MILPPFSFFFLLFFFMCGVSLYSRLSIRSLEEERDAAVAAASKIKTEKALVIALLTSQLLGCMVAWFAGVYGSLVCWGAW